VLHHPDLHYFIRAERDFDETTELARATRDPEK
jgi:hypothetical protein